MNKRKSKAPSRQCDQKRDENTVPIEDCIKLLREYEDFDVMRGFFEPGIEVPEGERFYDPIYAEVWG